MRHLPPLIVNPTEDSRVPHQNFPTVSVAASLIYVVNFAVETIRQAMSEIQFPDTDILVSGPGVEPQRVDLEPSEILPDVGDRA